MMVLALLTGLAAAPVTIHPDQLGPAVRHDPLGGFVLHVTNDSSLYPKIKKGMMELGRQVFRYPAGTVSNEYHWNGDGHFDADSVWVASDSSYSPGFSALGIHRGTSKNNCGVIKASSIDDGDTNTYWWSNPDLPASAGWFFFDFGKKVSVDSLSLRLGDLMPDSVKIQAWDKLDWVAYPQNLDGASWRPVATVPVRSLTGVKFSKIAVRYLAVKPIGALPRGWKVRECEVWGAGRKVSVSDPDETVQTRVVSTSAHVASRRDRWNWNWDFESYMDYVREYPGGVPVICVNIGAGSVQEAAAWVRYANLVRKYGIKRWQIGNEMSGAHEEGGPLTARQYATRYVQFAKAMKAVDPTISIVGPVTDPFVLTYRTGDGEGRSWMDGFLAYVDSAERADHARYADGIDIHPYPYYFWDGPDPQTYIHLADTVGWMYDSLAATMGRTFADQTGREVLITEYNPSLSRSSLDLDVIGGSGASLELAHFVQRFGDRGIALFFDLFEPSVPGPDGTNGALTTFLDPLKGAWSSMGYLPNSSFWALRTVLGEWLDPAGGDTVIGIDQTNGIRTFAVRNHGRVSVLAVNLASDSSSIQLDPSLFPNGGDFFSWGPGEYRPTATDGTTNPFPANGPSSRRILSNWNGAAKIPPYGMVVVRTGRVGKIPHTSSIVAIPRVTTVSDTFRLSGWSSTGGLGLAGGSWNALGASGGLVPTDGNWDGAAESWTALVPASALGMGNSRVRIVVVAASGDSAVDTVDLSVTGVLRPVVMVCDFEKGKTENVWGKAWWGQASAAIDSSGAELAIANGSLDGSKYLASKVHVGQSSGLGYTNSVSSIVPLPKGIAVSDSVRDVVGIGLDWNTSWATGCSYSVALNTSKVKDWDYHSVVLPATNGKWVYRVLLFGESKQAGWGAVVPFDVAALNQLEFRAAGDCDATISIDNLVLVGTRGEPVGTIARQSVARNSCVWRNDKLFVDVAGAWTVRLVGADGKTLGHWKGTGKGEFKASAPTSPSWAVLDADGIRQTIPVFPALR